MNQIPFMQQLETHDNELEVRERIAKGQYSGEHLGIAQEWLRRKGEARSSAATARAEVREEESLSISRKALFISKRSNIIAISAMILSVATAIIVAVIQFMLEKPSP